MCAASAGLGSFRVNAMATMERREESILGDKVGGREGGLKGRRARTPRFVWDE